MSTRTLSKADPAAAAALEWIQREPVEFIESVLGFEPWSKQREIIESVRDNPRTAVRSCHGSGKTAVAARIVLWFLAAYPRSRVISTAPTWTQVRDLLWAELHRGVARAPAGFYPSPDLTRLSFSPEHFAVGISTDQPERMQGHHAEHLLLVCDEASGVREEVYAAAEGFLTAGAGARVLLIGNPTLSSGTFYRAFTSERELWSTISISAEDTPRLTGEKVSEAVAANMPSPDWVAERASAWGEDSPEYAIRVLGEFPKQGSDQVIDLAAVEAAVAREVEPGPDLIVSCDVARYGSDETVIVAKRGAKITIEASYSGRSLMQTVGHISDVVARAGDYRDLRIVIDDAGLGGGVTDRLKERGYPVAPFTGAGRAHEPTKYPNRRSEAWWAFAEALPELDLPHDDQLIADLVAPRYAMDSAGRRVVEAKEKTRARLGRSPDRADAVLMACAPPPDMGASFSEASIY